MGIRIGRTRIKTSTSGITESIVVADGPNTRYEASFRSGGGMAIAALALASTMPANGEFPAARAICRRPKKRFNFLDRHNRELLNDGVENNP